MTLEEEIAIIRDEEMPSDYYPPKDLANVIWGQCFDYESIENNNIRERVKNSCFMLEKLHKIQMLCKNKK